MKRILLLQHADLPHPETLDFACYIAKLLNSPVTGVFLEDDKRETLKRVAPEDIGGAALPGEWGGQQTAYADPVVSHFSDACIYRESAYAVHSNIYVSIDDLLKETQFADLLLLRPDLSETKHAYACPSKLAKFVLEHAACPVMLVPRSFNTLDEIVFTYDGSKSSVFAIKQFTYLFSDIVSLKKVKLLLINDFVKVPSMREWLNAHYPEAEIIFLEGRTTEQLIRNLLPCNSSIVVMGAYSRAAFSMLMKKSNADPLMDMLENPIFIAHGVR